MYTQKINDLYQEMITKISNALVNEGCIAFADKQVYIDVKGSMISEKVIELCLMPDNQISVLTENHYDINLKTLSLIDIAQIADEL